MRFPQWTSYFNVFASGKIGSKGTCVAARVRRASRLLFAERESSLFINLYCYLLLSLQNTRLRAGYVSPLSKQQSHVVTQM